VITETQDSIREGSTKFFERAKTNVFIGRGIYGRAVEKREWYAVATEQFHGGCDGGNVIHSCTKDDWLAESTNMLD
jgi:hypothetical protein